VDRLGAEAMSAGVPPEDIEIARALVKRILIAMTGLEQWQSEALVTQFELQAACMVGMKGRTR